MICRWKSTCIILSILIALAFLFNLMTNSSNTLLENTHHTPAPCTWSPGDPTLYYLRTKLGVNYDASHWFHMSENFMTQHSILSASRMTTNSSTVYFAFDNQDFITELNGFTKLLVALGTLAAPSVPSTNVPLELKYVFLGSGLQSFLKGSRNTKSSSGSSVSSPADSSSAIARRSFLLPLSMVVEEQHVQLSPLVNAEARFMHQASTAWDHSHTRRRLTLSSSSDGNRSIILANSGAIPPSEHPQQCVKFLGRIGGMWPTPQRGHWFPNDGDITSFRAKIAMLCPAPKADPAVKKKPYKLVIYQRDLSRKLDNEIQTLEMLGRALPSDLWEVHVLMHTKDRSPCALAHALHDADVLLTPHGFQSMLLLFLPRPALLFEIFPYKYYKRGYGPLGKEYGVIHSGVMSPPLSWHTTVLLSLTTTADCMAGKQCRNYARGDNVHLTKHGVNRLVASINTKLLPLLGKDKVRDFLYSSRV